MFSLDIVDTDLFLDMPSSTQNLYFHLGMRADDDGFVSSPKKITGMVNCSNDDLKLLIAKNFILTFETGVIVIKDWKTNNYIRSDRYTPTKYIDEKSELMIGNSGNYMKKTIDNNHGIPNSNHLVDNLDTQVRLDKVSISIDKDIDKKISKHTYGEYQKVKLTEDEYQKLISAIGEKETKQYIDRLDGYLATKNKKYNSHCATIQNWYRTDHPGFSFIDIKKDTSLQNKIKAAMEEKGVEL